MLLFSSEYMKTPAEIQEIIGEVNLVQYNAAVNLDRLEEQRLQQTARKRGTIVQTYNDVFTKTHMNEKHEPVLKKLGLSAFYNPPRGEFADLTPEQWYQIADALRVVSEATLRPVRAGPDRPYLEERKIRLSLGAAIYGAKYANQQPQTQSQPVQQANELVLRNPQVRPLWNGDTIGFYLGPSKGLMGKVEIIQRPEYLGSGWREDALIEIPRNDLQLIISKVDSTNVTSSNHESLKVDDIKDLQYLLVGEIDNTVEVDC